MFFLISKSSLQYTLWYKYLYHNVRFFIFFSCFTYQISMYAACNFLPEEGVSPLFSFEYAVLKKNSFYIAEELFFVEQKPHSSWILFTQAYYGIINNITLVAIVPIFSQKPDQNHGKKTGLGDLLVQANYRIYDNQSDDYRYRIITTAGIQFPTATVTEKTVLTFNTTSFFLAITQDAATRDWYFYSNFAALINIKRDNLKFGDTLNFNIGIGKIFCVKGIVFTILAELSDFYSRPNRLNKIPDLSTGENFLFLGPSLRVRYKAFLFQAGIQSVVSHHARFSNNTIKYQTGVFVGYSF